MMMPFDVVQVMEALAGVDFTPVHFSKGYDVEEKVGILASELKTPALSNNSKPDSHRAFAIQIPALTYSQGQNFNGKTSENNANPHAMRKQRGSSIYYEPNRLPILLTSSPPLVSEFSPAPARLSGFWHSNSVSQKKPTMYGRPTSRGSSGRRELDEAVGTLTPKLPALPVLESEQTVISTLPPLLGPPGIERPLPPLPSAHSAHSVPSPRLERSPSISSTWSIESPVEMNLKEKKLQKPGMGAGLPPTPRPQSRK